VATALLFVPEIDELFKKPTVLKASALVVNAVIVVSLIWRLSCTARKGSRRPDPPSGVGGGLRSAMDGLGVTAVGPRSDTVAGIGSEG
jgi:hypothetical protein